jgi:inhibitor of cysteine peptidase
VLTLNSQSDGQTFEVGLGDLFSVVLYENPSTGYSWVLNLPSSVEVVNDDFVGFGLRADDGQYLVGGGAERVWILRVTEVGTLSLGAKYARAWEPEPIQVWTARLNVTL